MSPFHAESIHSVKDLDDTTDIHELLRSHSRPPAHIISKIYTLSEKLLRLNAKIAKFQEQLDELHLHRSALQSRYKDCVGLFAPIRRLPSELLVEIFRLSWNLPPAACTVSRSSDVSLKRLAHAPLLDVSQACSRWHEIALGTPSLWSTIELEGDLCSNPAKRDIAMRLLQLALQRSSNHPLDVTIKNTASGPPHVLALQLLARHSARWQRITIIGPFGDLRHLSRVKDSLLPQLESLSLHSWGSDDTSAFDMFQVAPSLNRLAFTGSMLNPAMFSNFPFEHLNEVRCWEFLGTAPALFTGMIPRLSPTSSLQLRLSLGSKGVESLDVRPAASDVSTLGIEFAGEFPIPDVRRILENVLNAVTLPSLTRLGFESVEYPQRALPWPHTQFLSFSHRSSFRTHLKELLLDDVAITEGELLESLATLPVLEQLWISDHTSSTPVGKQLLITDTLFEALTRKPYSPCLVPRLLFLDCRTMLRFDDKCYLQFVISRLRDDDVFESSLRSLPGHQRDLDPAVSACIDELCAENRLRFTFSWGERC
ncbi:hypothetical protein B0H11DRAFT_1829243 [Mycena galericulata]|nr:hypothetical protein B0H11DRAFT_1829243 [Mycena galericulata]